MSSLSNPENAVVKNYDGSFLGSKAAKNAEALLSSKSILSSLSNAAPSKAPSKAPSVSASSLDPNNTPSIKTGIQFLPKTLLMSDQSTPLEILQTQNPLPDIEKEVVKEIASSSSTSSYFLYGALTLFLLSLIAGAIILIVILVKNKKRRKNLSLIHNPNMVMTKLKGKKSEGKQKNKKLLVPENHMDLLVKERPDNEFNEDPPIQMKKVENKKRELIEEQLRERDIFPTHGIVENSEEAAFAKQYSYENLQDSMFARQLPKPQRKNQSSVWDSNVQMVKEEIEKSGQSLKDYMANTNAPIPETLMEAWNSPQLPKKLSDSYNSNVPKYAEKEMPALVLDATQQIPMDGKTMAYDAMQDILKAKKRAKVLGVKLPAVTKEQKVSIQKWMTCEEKELRDLATSLNTMI